MRLSAITTVAQPRALCSLELHCHSNPTAFLFLNSPSRLYRGLCLSSRSIRTIVTSLAVGRSPLTADCRASIQSWTANPLENSKREPNSPIGRRAESPFEPERPLDYPVSHRLRTTCHRESTNTTPASPSKSHPPGVPPDLVQDDGSATQPTSPLLNQGRPSSHFFPSFVVPSS